MQVYLDNAATTPLAPEVLQEMMPYLTDHFGNPSAQHSFGRKTRAAIEQARKTVAGHLKARPSEIIFTSGGTESNNLALMSAVRNHKVRRIISTPIEHHCILHTLEALALEEQVEVKLLQVDRHGFIDLAELEQVLQSSGAPTLVSVMHANNEVGTLQDLAGIAAISKKHGALVHSDTVQTMGHYAIDLSVLPVDFLVGSAHKFHGPKGSGFLFARKGTTITPIVHGGGQERNKRPGTENVYGIVGLARAMDLACGQLAEEQAHIQSLKDYFIQGIADKFEEATINGAPSGERSLYTVINISFPPHPKGALLLFDLDMQGVAASGGSACNSGASTGSHVIDALGGSKGIPIRFSFSRYTTIADLDYAIEKIGLVFDRSMASG